MPETTRLYRSHTYPYKLNETVELEKYIDTKGGTYLITVQDDNNNFTLQLPTGEDGKYDSITDSFKDFMNRAELYKRLDEGVFEFMLETMDNLETEYLKQKGNRYVITMNKDKYVFTLDKATGMMKIEYPTRISEFYLANIYLENPDLPLLYDGRLNQHLQDKMKKWSVKMPKTPYEPGLKLVPKVKATS